MGIQLIESGLLKFEHTVSLGRVNGVTTGTHPVYYRCLRLNVTSCKIAALHENRKVDIARASPVTACRAVQS